MSLGTLLGSVESRARNLGHELGWNTVGESIANGACSHCGLTVSVATSPQGHGEATGEALRKPCRGIGRGKAAD